MNEFLFYAMMFGWSLFVTWSDMARPVRKLFRVQNEWVRLGEEPPEPFFFVSKMLGCIGCVGFWSTLVASAVIGGPCKRLHDFAFPLMDGFVVFGLNMIVFLTVFKDE